MAATQKIQIFDPGFLFAPSDSFQLKDIAAWCSSTPLFPTPHLVA